jgi:hypothetical protein
MSLTSQHSCLLQMQIPLLPQWSAHHPMKLTSYDKCSFVGFLLFSCFLITTINWGVGGGREQFAVLWCNLAQKQYSGILRRELRETTGSTNWSPSRCWSNARMSVNTGARFPKWSFCNKTSFYPQPH